MRRGRRRPRPQARQADHEGGGGHCGCGGARRVELLAGMGRGTKNSGGGVGRVLSGSRRDVSRRRRFAAVDDSPVSGADAGGSLLVGAVLVGLPDRAWVGRVDPAWVGRVDHAWVGHSDQASWDIPLNSPFWTLGRLLVYPIYSSFRFSLFAVLDCFSTFFANIYPYTSIPEGKESEQKRDTDDGRCRPNLGDCSYSYRIVCLFGAVGSLARCRGQWVRCS
jgi:hypothetical protein